MFGLPGDFNLGFLVCPIRIQNTALCRLIYCQDLVEDHPNIEWVGNWCVVFLCLRSNLDLGLVPVTNSTLHMRQTDMPESRLLLVPLVW